MILLYKFVWELNGLYTPPVKRPLHKRKMNVYMMINQWDGLKLTRPRLRQTVNFLQPGSCFYLKLEHNMNGDLRIQRPNSPSLASHMKKPWWGVCQYVGFPTEILVMWEVIYNIHSLSWWSPTSIQVYIHCKSIVNNSIHLSNIHFFRQPIHTMGQSVETIPFFGHENCRHEHLASCDPFSARGDWWGVVEAVSPER